MTYENKNTADTTALPRRRRPWLGWAVLFALGLAAGALLFGGGDSNPASSGMTEGGSAAETWTCSMHPQVQAPEPGKCPICFMDLIPVSGDSGGEGPTRLTMSESAMRLAEVVTAPVTRQRAKSEVRTVGRVQVDERRLRRLTSWVDGRLDRLFVDYTGVNVAKGDHLVEIYSPELYSAQVELIESVKAEKDLGRSKVDFLRESAAATSKAAREKLRLLGLQPGQIQDIETRGEASEHVTLYAPIAGVVIHKAAVEGEYVKTGSPIYTIADLSQVWVMLDVYESDLVWIQYGQDVSFEVEAFPGEEFTGQIAFVDPVVNPSTRTVKVRVNVKNENLRLKPDMFVRAVIRSELLGDGRSQSPDLAGKWICPMHPEVVKDTRGLCDICEMALVPAEELGLVRTGGDEGDPLIIPATAPLITGKRAIVYVRVPHTDRPTFEGREVVLGPKAGNHYVVESGLSEGELVVVNGNFKIDSAMQIQAKPSMMSPADAPDTGHSHGGSPETGLDLSALTGAPAPFVESLGPLYGSYFALQTALANDDLEMARTESEALQGALEKTKVSQLNAGAGNAWKASRETLEGLLETCSAAPDIETARLAFADISRLLIALDRTAGPPSNQEHSLIYCSMAFNNRGAYWLQDNPQIQNPFYGESMKRCGELKETFTTGSSKP